MPKGVYKRTPAQLAVLAAAREKRLVIARAITHCPRNHELSGDNLIIIKRSDGTRRECRKCRVAAAARSRKRNYVPVVRKMRIRIIDDPIMANYQRRRLFEQASKEAVGELADLVAEQIKDDKRLIITTPGTQSLDAKMEGGATLYDVVAIQDYQEELQDRLDRLTGY